MKMGLAEMSLYANKCLALLLRIAKFTIGEELKIGAPLPGDYLSQGFPLWESKTHLSAFTLS